MNPALIITGIAILLLGRQLFWLFVAVVGFTIGFTVAQSVLSDQPLWVIWAIGLGTGLVGALLAFFIQKVAIAAGGFLAGYHIVAGFFSMSGHPLGWPIGLIAGILGAVLLFFFFDWALIGLSSAAGALMIVNGITASMLLEWILFWGLLVAGALFQLVWWRQHSAAPDRSS